MGWGIPASILLHAVFAFILFFHLPLDVAEPQKEESVSVEIVPPPEEPKAEEKAEEQKPPEQPKPEQPKPEEAKKEEPPPPPPEPEKKEEAKKEDAKKEEQPPPPPPPPPAPPKEEAKQPEPPPPKQEEAKQEEQPGNEQSRPQPVPVLRPVFQFGEKDTGPRKSEKGNAAQEAGSPSEAKPDVTEAEQPKPTDKKPEDVVEAPPATPVPDDINVPEIDVASANPQLNGPSSGAAPDALLMEIVPPPPSVSAKTDPAKTPTQNNAPELKEAKTLFSSQATNDPIAMTAMGNLPRGTRAGELCSTELREQLRNASYWPDFLPSPRLPTGTVLDAKGVGFRARGQWYDLSFRCEIDADATKVVSFAFRVGDAVPRGEWRKRGFPEF